MSDPNVWAERTRHLIKDAYLRSQVERLMPALTLIRGTKDVMGLEETVHQVAQLVALLEVKGLDKTANIGGIQVVRGQGVEGYSIMLHASDIYVTHMSPYEDAMEYWRKKDE